MSKSVEVVLTPALLPLYEVKQKAVVVIDILRATSSMCVAFHTGVNKILPVSTPEECAIFKDFDFLCAAERNAIKLPGFDMGNSPFEFQNPLIKGRNVALTTTNGTKAIKQSKELGASNIVIGATHKYALQVGGVGPPPSLGNNPIICLPTYDLQQSIFIFQAVLKASHIAFDFTIKVYCHIGESVNLGLIQQYSFVFSIPNRD